MNSYEATAKTCGVLLLLTCAVACIPAFGFLVWVIAGPVLLVTFILSIIVLSRGGTGPGIFLLFMTLVGAPAFIVVAPILTTAAVGSALPSKLPVPTPFPHPDWATPVPKLAAPARTPKPITAAADAQARAVRRFPGIGQPGTIQNRKFLEEVKRAQVEESKIFDNPEWPSILAARVAERYP